MEDQDFPLLGVFGELLGVMSDGVSGVLVNDSDVRGVLVSDRDVEGFDSSVYGVPEGDRGVWSSH